MKDSLSAFIRRPLWSVAVGAALLAACASLPPPTESLARAERTLQRADEAKAVETAPLEMKSAREKLTQAREAVVREDMTTAATLAGQATLDAELAIAKQEAAKAQAVNNELMKGNQVLREELNRNTTTKGN